MAVDVHDIEQRLESDDADVIIEALQSLTFNSEPNKKLEALDANASEKLIPLCVVKLQHENIAVKARAAEVIADQMRIENSHMTPYLVSIAKILSTVNNTDLSLGKDDPESHATFHKNSCNIITEMQYHKPELLMPSFKPLGQYLVTCTANKNRAISTAACNYWARLLVPPVSAQLIESWLPAILNKLGKLVPTLLKCFIYNEQYINFLDSDSDGQDIPAELEEFTNCRNFAALGFENICRIFTSEVIIILKPLVPKYLKSKDWQLVEAILLAVAAFTKAVGTPKEMNDLYQELIPSMLDLYSHPQPLVRAINCFAMQQFINVNIKGIKDPFTKMLKCTLNLIQDSNKEVQEMAINSLSAMLAFANRDIVPFSKKLIGELTKADSVIKGRARFTYYECIGHIFGRLATLLSEEDAKQLIKPLIEEWHTLQWNSMEDAEQHSADTFMLCQSMCVIAMFSQAAFAPYNEDIFGKIVPYLQKILDGSIGEADKSGEVITQHMVAYLDVLSAMFEGQGKNLGSMIHKNYLVEVIIGILEDSKLDNSVHQSALALLGHICTHSFEKVKPHLDNIMDLLSKELSKEVTAIKNNALWVLSPVILNYPRNDTQILQYTDQLEKILMSHNLDQGTAINATIALTHMGARWPEQMASQVLKEEIFAVICGLLHQQFPRDLEKVTIFKNLCVIIKPNAKVLSRDACTQICMAAAICDVHDPELIKSLRTVLRDVRSAVGGNGWNKVSQQMGNQMAYSLRKRYKLY